MSSLWKNREVLFTASMLGGLLIVVAVQSLRSWYVVPEGEAGVLYRFGKVSDKPALEPGRHYVHRLLYEVAIFSVEPGTSTIRVGEPCSVSASDSADLSISWSVTDAKQVFAMGGRDKIQWWIRDNLHNGPTPIRDCQDTAVAESVRRALERKNSVYRSMGFEVTSVTHGVWGTVEGQAGLAPAN